MMQNISQEHGFFHFFYLHVSFHNKHFIYGATTHVIGNLDCFIYKHVDNKSISVLDIYWTGISNRYMYIIVQVSSN